MRRILIVDDEELIADTLGLIFRQHGFDARTAYSASEALQCARSFEPELLLCDIQMPGGDGVELIGDLSQELPGCRILVLTAFQSMLERVRERAHTLPQPVVMMVKPCQPTEL